jgi:integrase
MEPYRDERSGLFRPRVPSRVPRSVPDEEFNEIFARLPSHRDRALVAFYVSTGARASELLSATVAGADPGRQLITVVRKGTGHLQELPASTDAFVWLRLYQVEMAGLIPGGRRQPLWWTVRRPVRPLTYHAVHRMFERVNQKAGTAATLHSLRHTAAYRMAEDPALPLTDVILSFRVSQGCDLRRPVMDSVADGTLAALSRLSHPSGSLPDRTPADRWSPSARAN